MGKKVLQSMPDKMKKVRIIELVLDWNIWPRHTNQRLDATNLAKMKLAIKSGYALPQPIVNAKDMRIVDGFHRVTAYKELFGDDFEIEVVLRDYLNDAAVHLDAGRLNDEQGQALTPQDKVHFILKCRRLKIPVKAIADALHSDSDYVKNMIAKRTAKTQSGQTIALPHGAKALAGKKLTKEQEDYVHRTDGNVPEMHTRMLMDALKSNSVIFTDKTYTKLKELYELLEEILKDAGII